MKCNTGAMHAVWYKLQGEAERLYQHIREADAELRRAEASLRHACEIAWPIGTEVEFYINGNQVKPSRGTVCHYHDGRIGVRMETRNWGGTRNTVKRVHYTNMATPPAHAARAAVAKAEVNPDEKADAKDTNNSANSAAVARKG